MNRIKTHFWLLFFLLINSNVFSQVLIDFHTQWSYFKGTTEPSNPYTDWVKPDFDYSGWSKGTAPFSYGYGNDGTLLSDMLGNYSTCYFRNKFQISNLDGIDNLKISMGYDDGFILWINGKEITRRNVSTTPAYYYRYASGIHNANELEIITIPKINVDLTEGENTIAIQGFNVSKTNYNFYL